MVFLSFGTHSQHIWNVIIQAVYHLEPGLEHLKCGYSCGLYHLEVVHGAFGMR